jgi:hypothetical protein
LYAETESLSRSLESITTVLQNPSIERHNRLPIWEDVHECLSQCQRSILAFDQRLEKIKPKETDSGNILKKSLDAFKLHFRDDEVKMLRTQLQSHTTALQMVLQMITVHINSNVPEVILNVLSPQIQLLVKLVTQLHTSSFALGNADAGLRRSRTRLEKSAKQVASRASAVISSR